MKIALFGGAFNPIHVAHVKLAVRAMNTFSIDKVILMPTFDSPHKDTTKSVTFDDRINMCKLAVNNDDRFVVSDLEGQLGGKSYSYITLSKLKEMYPDDELFMIIGADMYLSLLQWKNPELIFSLASIITCPRDDGSYEELLKFSETLSTYGCKSYILKSPIMELSSTSIRNNFEDYHKRGLINERVYDYAVKHHLYEVK